MAYHHKFNILLRNGFIENTCFIVGYRCIMFCRNLSAYKFIKYWFTDVISDTAMIQKSVGSLLSTIFTSPVNSVFCSSGTMTSTSIDVSPANKSSPPSGSKDQSP